jgi:hypothetical protein
MGPSGLPGADCITTFFDGVLPLNVLPAMIEDDDPWPVEFDPASRKDGIQLDPSNHVLTVSSGGYYLLNWIGDVSNVNTQGSRLKLYINGAPANGIELDKPGNGILEGQHIVYLNAGDEVQFQFDGTPGTGNFSLDSLFIDVSQLNSWQ